MYSRAKGGMEVRMRDRTGQDWTRLHSSMWWQWPWMEWDARAQRGGWQTLGRDLLVGIRGWHPDRLRTNSSWLVVIWASPSAFGRQRVRRRIFTPTPPNPCQYSQGCTRQTGNLPNTSCDEILLRNVAYPRLTQLVQALSGARRPMFFVYLTST